MADLSKSVKCNCNDFSRLPPMRNLAPSAIPEACQSSQYYFNGEKFKLSMDTRLEFPPIATIHLTDVRSGSWNVKMEAITWKGRFEYVPVVFDIGHTKLIVPKALERNFEKDNTGRPTAIGHASIRVELSEKEYIHLHVRHRDIGFHDSHGKDYWIFGRKVMRQHKYSFRKDASGYRISIGLLDPDAEEARKNERPTKSDKNKQLRKEKARANALKETTDDWMGQYLNQESSASEEYGSGSESNSVHKHYNEQYVRDFAHTYNPVRSPSGASDVPNYDTPYY